MLRIIVGALLVTLAADWCPGSDLSAVYESRDVEALDRLLRKWGSSTRPIANWEHNRKPRFERAAYRVASALYERLLAARDEEDDDVAPPPVHLLPTSVRIELGDTSLARVFKDESKSALPVPPVSRLVVQNFRPPIETVERVVFVSPFNDQLRDFVDGDSLPREERRRRIDFLRKRVNVHPGHFGGPTILFAPVIATIRFNRDFTRALVGYRSWDSGLMEARMEVADGDWRVIDTYSAGVA